MPKIIRPIGHEDRLSVVDHLDELRSRLISAGIFVVVVFAVCFWQNHALLTIVNNPLKKVHPQGLASTSQRLVNVRHSDTKIEADFERLERALPSNPAAQAAVRSIAADFAAQRAALPRSALTDKPITLGPGEPFTITITVVFYFAILFSLPMLLYQLYAFVIPALSPTEQKVARPVALGAPLLFVVGAVFTYFLVLPPAVKFLQGYNSSQFDAVVQAAPFYKFEVLTMIGIGLAFEVPLVLLALQRAGIVNGKTLTGNWRYAILVISIIVAILPGVDPVTMAFEMLPLLLLYLASIVMLKFVDRRDAAKARKARDAAIVLDEANDDD
jgi:sec-independent protein translocase protein TatC